LQNIKSQAPNLRVSGVPPEADQVSGVREEKKLKPETHNTGKAMQP
jgi:hypothetical protein